MFKGLISWFKGRPRRDWSVVDDGDEIVELAIYACPTSRIDPSDKVLASGLTWDETERVVRHGIAARLVAEAREARHG